MRIANFPTHSKNKSMNISLDNHNRSVFFQNVFDNSQNFKKMAGKNYDKFTKCLPQIKSSIVNIFSSDAQKSRAMNYVKTLRNRNNPVISLRKKMLSQNINSSFFMENSINNSYVQNIFTGRPRETQYSQYDLSNILGDIDEDGKNLKKKEVIYDNIDDEQNENETISTDKKSTGITLGSSKKNYYNKTINSSDKKENHRVINFGRDPMDFIKNQNFFQIQKFSINISNKGNNNNKLLFRQESENFSLISNNKSKHKPKAKSLSSVRMDDNDNERILSPIKTSLLRESPIKYTPEKMQYKSKNGVNEMLEKIKLIKKHFNEISPSKKNVFDDKNFTGYIITQVYNGKKIKSYKYLNEDNISEIKGITIDDVLIGDELFNRIPKTTMNKKVNFSENILNNKEINKTIKKEQKQIFNKSLQNKEISKLKVDNICFSPKKKEQKIVYVKEKKIILTHESIPESIEEEALTEISPHYENKNYSFSRTPRLNTIASLETNESFSSLKEISSPELDFPDKTLRKMRFEQIMRGKFPENIILIEKNESTNKKKPQMISVNNNYSKPKKSEKNKKFEGKLNKNCGNVLRQKLLATKQ